MGPGKLSEGREAWEKEQCADRMNALMPRYAEAYPKEDGYRHPETLNEDILGTALWTAAKVTALLHYSSCQC